MAAVPFEERRVGVAGGELSLAVRVWAPKVAPPVQRCIAWPGWLDNAGSFDSLAPHFAAAGYEFVAVDPPGCGLSDHLPPSAAYMDIDEALMVIELADALHYDPCAPFVLVGHSRGCSVATACAAGFPDRVCALVTFESAYGLIGCFPMNQGVAATTGNHKLELVLAADRAGLARGKRTRVFESLQAAIDHNHRNKRFVKAAHTSENIVRRHVHQVPNGGWQLTHDPRLYVQTQPIYSDELVCRSVLRGLRCNTINVRASNFRDRWRKMIRNEASGEQWSKIAWWERMIEEREALLRSQHRLTVETIDGGHHVHSDKPQSCADIVLPWLQAQHLPAAPQLMDTATEMQRPKSKRIDDEAISVPEDLWTLEPTPVHVPPATEQIFAVRGNSLLLAAKVWTPLATGIDRRAEPAKRVLAWPGWLDNAGSFDNLAPLMVEAGYTVCAVDPPGCGKSDHLPTTSNYSTEAESLLAIEILMQLGWGPEDGGAILLAHSRGGNVLLRCASGFPNAVRGLVFLENNLGYSQEFSPQMFADMLASERRNRARVPRSFRSAEAAIQKSYMNKQFPKSWATARNITVRHIEPDKSAGQGVVTFSHDVRTYGERQALATTPQMLLEVISRVSCPVFMMTSELNEWRSLEERTIGREITKKKSMLAPGQLTDVVIYGEHHHVHSDNAAATWGTGLKDWLESLGFQHASNDSLQIVGGARAAL